LKYILFIGKMQIFQDNSAILLSLARPALGHEFGPNGEEPKDWLAWGINCFQPQMNADQSGFVSIIWALNIRICFGFRIWYLEFPAEGWHIGFVFSPASMSPKTTFFSYSSYFKELASNCPF